MYLVIGGTGRIGREVVRLLAAGDHPVRALVRDPFAASSLTGPGIELIQGDLARPETLGAVFNGATRVFLVTASGPDTVPLQRAAIAAARAAGVERLVRVSALGVGHNLPVKLTGWHGEVEAILAESGVPGVNLRPTSYMQNFLGSADLIRTTGQFFGTSGEGKVAWVDARDVALAGVGALTHPEPVAQAVALTGPQSLSQAEIAAVFSDVLGRTVSYVDIPAEAWRAGLTGAGMPEWLAADLVTLETLGRDGAAPIADGVERLSGAPPRPLRQFVADYRAAFA